MTDSSRSRRHLDIKWEALFRCPISHTSVMIRRRVLSEVGGYSLSPMLKVASDYDLLSRIVMHYEVANLSEPLVKWRRHPGASMISNEAGLRSGVEDVSLRNIVALRSREESSAEESDREYCYLGSRAFLCTPSGQLPGLPPEQVIAGLRFLCDLQDTFCRSSDCSRTAAARLRRRLNRTWGKHALALAIRARWGLVARGRIFFEGARMLSVAAYGGIPAPTGRPE